MAEKGGTVIASRRRPHGLPRLQRRHHSLAGSAMRASTILPCTANREEIVLVQSKREEIVMSNLFALWWWCVPLVMVWQRVGRPSLRWRLRWMQRKCGTLCQRGTLITVMPLRSTKEEVDSQLQEHQILVVLDDLEMPAHLLD